jgi:predicted enzyme related to lactoylglutathione lyase
MLQNSEAFSGYSVDDIEKAKDFYKNLLGLKVKDNPMGLLELHFQNGHSVILYPKPNHEAATFTVLNFPVKNIENAVDNLITKGIKFLQYKEPIKTDNKGICWSDEGPNIAWFKDPAGNILSVLEV